MGCRILGDDPGIFRNFFCSICVAEVLAAFRAGPVGGVAGCCTGCRLGCGSGQLAFRMGCRILGDNPGILLDFCFSLRITEILSAAMAGPVGFDACFCTGGVDRRMRGQPVADGREVSGQRKIITVGAGDQLDPRPDTGGSLRNGVLQAVCQILIAGRERFFIQLQGQPVLIAGVMEKRRDALVRIYLVQRADHGRSAGFVKPVQERFSVFVLDQHIAAYDHFAGEEAQRFAVYSAEEADGSLAIHIHRTELLFCVFLVHRVTELQLLSVAEHNRAAELIGGAGGGGIPGLNAFRGIRQPHHQAGHAFVVQDAGLDKVLNGVIAGFELIHHIHEIRRRQLLFGKEADQLIQREAGARREGGQIFRFDSQCFLQVFSVQGSLLPGIEGTRQNGRGFCGRVQDFISLLLQDLEKFIICGVFRLSNEFRRFADRFLQLFLIVLVLQFSQNPGGCPDGSFCRGDQRLCLIQVASGSFSVHGKLAAAISAQDDLRLILLFLYGGGLSVRNPEIVHS